MHTRYNKLYIYTPHNFTKTTSKKIMWCIHVIKQILSIFFLFTHFLKSTLIHTIQYGIVSRFFVRIARYS